jgi:hypothetical protein
MSHEHEFRALCEVVVQALHLIGRHGDKLSQTQQEILVDTKKLLDTVKQERSEKESLLALVRANTKALEDASSQNQDMVRQIAELKAKVDAVASPEDGAKDKQIAELKQTVTDLQSAADQAQRDIDQAAADLSADDSEVQDAIKANVPQQAGQQQGASAGASAGSGSSSSLSAGSGGGGGNKPQPMAGTGAPAGDSQNQAQNSGAASGSGLSGDEGGQGASTSAPTDTPALSGGIADPDKPGSMPPPEDADAAGQAARTLGSDPQASRGPQSGA